MDLELRRDGVNGSSVGGSQASPAEKAAIQAAAAKWKHDVQNLQGQIQNFRQNLSDNPALANDPEIQAQEAQLNAQKVALERQGQSLQARANGAGSPAASGTINAQGPGDPNALKPVEAVDPQTGTTAVQWKAK